ncbi:MAG: hypothetical protein HYV94_03635 [Candidatus Rokubacteria bacterium]|nr:hypothetical protein [Candidatus Rokubacteria bacterium]
MTPQGLRPGDRVIDLAGLVRSAALGTGAVSAAWGAWLVRGSWLTSLAALLIGAGLGYIVAEVVSRVLYRRGDNTTVVKVGLGSLGSTIPAGLAGGLATAIIVALVALLPFGADGHAALWFGVSLASGVALGLTFACGSSLL